MYVYIHSVIIQVYAHVLNCSMHMLYIPARVYTMHILQVFSTQTVGLMSSQWRSNKSVRVWMIRKSCEVFSEKFDKIQKQLQSISCMDKLLSGKSTFDVE